MPPYKPVASCFFKTSDSEVELNRDSPRGEADDTTLMEEREEWKSLLIKVKEESEKFGLKLNIQKTKIMASGPITSWQRDGKTVETVTDFIIIIFFLEEGSKIPAEVTAAMKLRHLLLGRKIMANLDSILKGRDITLPTNVYGRSYNCDYTCLIKICFL